MSTVPVLFQGQGILAVDKPAGRTVIPARAESSAPSILEELEVQLGQKLFVVHRLDRDTSGVLVFALDAATHREVSMAFEAGRVGKRYLGLVEGVLDSPREVDLALVPARRGKMRPARPGEEGKRAVTRFAPLESFPKATWVEAIPLTGRTHQIRVHLRSIEHPLCFDHQYGSDQAIKLGDVVLARTPLHAEKIRIPARGDLPPLELTAPLADDLSRLLQALRRGDS